MENNVSEQEALNLSTKLERGISSIELCSATTLL